MLAELPRHVSSPDPSLYGRGDYLVVDFETTTFNKGSPLDPRNRIVLACWKWAGTGVSHTFGSEFEQGGLVEAVKGASFIVAHNAKFELGWLRRCGVDLRKVVVYDTQIGEFVRGGNRYNLVMLGLDATLARYKLGGKKSLCSMMLKLGLNTEDFPRSWLLEYCERDVEATEELFKLQLPYLEEKGLLHLMYQRCLLCPALADIEFNGMQLDSEEVQAQTKIQEEAYAAKEAEFQRFMGGVSPSSTKQKAEYVYGVLKFPFAKDTKGKPMKTSTGQGSVAAVAIDRLRPRTDKQRAWMALQRAWATLNSDVTKYLRKFNQCCEEAGGVLHATFNQCIARTHRLTCSGFEYKVQLMNLNRNFKPIFKARHDGWLMGEIDGAQIEYRVAMHQGRDKQGYKDITSGADVHKYTASVLLSKPEEEVTRAERQEAKKDTFKPTYGGTSGSADQQRYYAAFAEKYSALTATQKGWTHKVLNEKKLRTEYGMIFYWPECKMTQSGYITHSTNIYNYPVQGLATAEIIPIGLVCAWHRMKDMRSFLVNTVHDSIIGEIHPEETELWHEVAKQCLINDCYMILDKLYDLQLTVPLGTGVMIGRRWADVEAKNSEVVYEADPALYIEAAKREGMV